MRREILRMERVSCLERGVVQLDGFNLSILSGEIMGLLPINNHGLTALLRLLQHNTPLRYGYVYYKEEQVNTWRTSKHRTNRIGVIQSESSLVEGLTVADNIFVLRPEFKTWVISPLILKKQVINFLHDIDINISADSYVGELTEFEKVVVDVLKSVVAGYKLIAIRDISTNICESDLKKIHRLLKYYAGRGISFLYIDFHYEELRQACDKIALMSNGRIVKVLNDNRTTSAAFESYTRAFSSKIKQQMHLLAEKESEAETAFEATGVTGSLGLIKSFNLKVMRGECVVVQNVDIKVFDELLLILNGESSPVGGTIKINNNELSALPVRDIAIIQELPTKTMLFNEMSYIDNLCFLIDHRLPEIWLSRKLRDGIRRQYADILGDDVFDKRIDSLSEMQKYELVYTRIAIQNPKVVFCVQPFRRADVELRMHIWGLIKMLLDKEIAIVILAVNLSDSLSLAHRLIRTRKDKPPEIYMQSEFSTLEINAPWIDLWNSMERDKL